VSKRAYICLHLTLICAYVMLPFYYVIQTVQQSPNWPVTGFISDLFGVPDSQPPFGLQLNIVIMCLTMLCYLLVALLFKCKTAGNFIINIIQSRQKKYRKF
jgi:hypothetical protein